MKKAVLLGVLAAAWPSSAPAQGLEAACAGIPELYQGRCMAVVQAAHSVQPALGIAIAGGSPTLGTPGALGAGPGFRPRVRLSARLNLTSIHIPDITVEDDAREPAPATQERSVLTAVLGAGATVGIVPGFSPSPAVGGIGAVDLLGTVSYLPYDLIGRDVYKGESSQLAWGVGGRLGLLRESAATPGVAVSLMYRSIGSVQIGNVCEGTPGPDAGNPAVPPPTLCRERGDVGQVTTGLAGLSTRATVSKTLRGLGVAAGVGYDRYDGDVDLYVRAERVGGTSLGAERIYNRPGYTLESDRMNVFLNLSYGVRGGTIVGELGWMQGGDAIIGFSSDHNFDPGAGTIFGSLGGRFAL